MRKFKGGNRVGKGTYWNLSNGRREDVSGDAVLPGDEDSTYLKVPSIVVLLLGPILGLLYVITLPFIGIAMVLMLLIGKVNIALVRVFGRTVSFGWRPIESYLSGKKRKGKSN